MPKGLDLKAVTSEVHIFADASKKAYGAIAYLRTETEEGRIHLSFILARSNVAPKCMHSIPHLELRAGLVAALISRNAPWK